MNSFELPYTLILYNPLDEQIGAEIELTATLIYKDGNFILDFLMTDDDAGTVIAPDIVGVKYNNTTALIWNLVQDDFTNNTSLQADALEAYHKAKEGDREEDHTDFLDAAATPWHRG